MRPLKNPETAVLACKNGLKIVVAANVIDKKEVDLIPTHVKRGIFSTVINIKDVVAACPNPRILNGYAPNSLSNGRGHVKELFTLFRYPDD